VRSRAGQAPNSLPGPRLSVVFDLNSLFSLAIAALVDADRTPLRVGPEDIGFVTIYLLRPWGAFVHDHPGHCDL